MSKYAEQVMVVLIILVAAVIMLLLAGEMDSLQLMQTQTVNIRRAAAAPVIAVIVGVIAYIWRNHK